MKVWLLLLTAWLASGLGLQAQPDPPVDSTFYAVSYFETRASSATVAADALHKYRDASRKLPGFVRIDFFEQIGRPGHFAVFETWRDQPAFDGRDAAIQKTLLAALEPIRVADADTLKRMEDNDQVVFRYVENPNGSIHDIAGIVNEKRNVLGMMPHPDRSSEALLGSTDGRLIFESMVNALVV